MNSDSQEELGILLDRLQERFASLWSFVWDVRWSGVLLLSVFDEVAGKPRNDVGRLVEFRRRRWHLLTTGRTLSRDGVQIVVVADGKLWNHVAIPWMVRIWSRPQNSVEMMTRG